MTILVMQPLPVVATDWLAAQGAEILYAYEGDAWQAAAHRVRALIYYSIPIDKALLDQLPALEIIGKRGAGIDSVDLDETRRRGIPVSNVAGSNASSVSEHAVMLLLAATRDVARRDAATRAGQFTTRFAMPLVKEVNHTRVGIVGAGNIGRRIGQILRDGFGCEIGYVDPYAPDAAFEGAERHGDVASLFAWAEHAVIAAPLTDESRGSIGLPELGALGAEATLVIISRGGIVDEDALATALRTGVIRAAGLDVYDREPPRDDHPLFALPEALLTPHTAGASDRSRDASSLLVCQQVWAYLNGEGVPMAAEQPWL